MMISHFSFYNQIHYSQSFALSKKRKNLVYQWQEMHKREKKKKSFCYLAKLKKRKRFFSALARFKPKYSFYKKDFKLLPIQDAHNHLFSIKKPALKLTFCEKINSRFVKSRIHVGYNVDGDILWKQSKTSILN